MKFVNRRDPVQVRIEVNGKYEWILLKTGQTIDIPEQQGINYGFDRIEATKGKIGEIEVETKQIEKTDKKQIEYTSDGLFLKELIKIKGIGKKTAEDIVEWGTKEKLIEYVKENKKLPFRDDVVLLLEENYGKRA